MRAQLWQRRKRGRVIGHPAALELKCKGLELVHEDAVVEQDQVAALFAVDDC